MQLTKCAVIGVGYLGSFHAQKFAAIDTARLVAVVDIDDRAAAAAAETCGCRALTDYRQVMDQVDAVSIAVPTRRHFEIARAFLDAGIHVLLEKPIASTVEEARSLVELARKRGVVFQIGHLERFNPAFMDLGDFELNPLFIESHRVAPFKLRGTDVDVVLDLMTRDIDLILGMVKSPVSSLAASGTSVLSDALDIVNARLEFENGCVANVTSSRVSLKSERRMRIFQPEAYISIDFQNSGLAIHRLGDEEMFPGVPEILREESSFEHDHDPLMREIEAFVASVREGAPVVVSGEDGARALEIAMRIRDMVESGSPVALSRQA